MPDKLHQPTAAHHCIREDTHCNPVRNKITFVDDKHNLLVGLFLFDVFQDRLAQRSHGISSIENMQNDIRGIYDFIEFAVYPARSTLGVDRLDDIGVRLEVIRCRGRCSKCYSMPIQMMQV